MGGDPEATRKSRIEALLAGAFLSLLAFGLAFAAVELVARRLLQTRSPIEQRFPVEHSRQPRPYVMFSGEPSTLDFNAMGYRGEVPRSPKPDTEFRIFFLGGSTVVNGEPPISDLLQDLFEARGMPQVRVYNFGVVSSVSSMELVKIVTEVVDLEPDMIVMYNGGNDVLHPWSWDPRPGHPFNFVAFEGNVLFEPPGGYPALRLLAFESAILRLLLRDRFLDAFVGLEDVRQQVAWGSEAWKQEVAEIYVENLRKAQRVSAAFGSEFFAFFQPLVYFKSPLTPEEESLIADREKAGYCIEMRQRIVKRLAALARRGLPAVDLSALYQGETRRVFEDAIHTVQDAKPRMAGAIFDQVEPRVALSPK